ncbi:MAG: hypothetical protein ACLFR1_01455 [Spirochaetia bacterium]
MTIGISSDEINELKKKFTITQDDMHQNDRGSFYAFVAVGDTID